MAKGRHPLSLGQTKGIPRDTGVIQELIRKPRLPTETLRNLTEMTAKTSGDTGGVLV